MGAKIRLVEQTDWSGGINVVTSPFLLTKKQALRVRNMTLDEHGSLSTRDGYSVLTTSPDTANPIVYRSALNTNAGTTFAYAMQNDGTHTTLRRTDPTPWTSIPSTPTAYGTPQAVTAN